MKKEKLARSLVILFILIAVAIPFIGQQLWQSDRTNAIEIHGRMPENGGWSLNTINAEVGKPIRLRITSDDVVHGFAIGKSELPSVEILPGEFIETTLLFDKPGKYTFYCDRWCGPNHWRMRGTIEVSGEGTPSINQPPLYLQLGIDIDVPHLAESTPNKPVSSEQGAKFAKDLPAYALEKNTYFSNSPAKLWMRLRAESNLSGLSDSDLWDTVAWIWQQNTSPAAINAGKTLFAENCAACHGETGKGDGVMVRDLPEWDPKQHETGNLQSDTTMAGLMRPPDFSHPHFLLGASPALLEGKIIRGGMGTGMPYWGPIFTEEQLNQLISYIYRFVWQPSIRE